MATQNRRIVVVHVYIGGRTLNNFSKQAFELAIEEFNKLHNNIFLYCVSKNCRDVKHDHWGFKDLIDWLYHSDVHFIITHLHQGNSGNGAVKEMGWDVGKLYEYLDKLYDHPGYPSGENLRCPIFTQNKFEYLKPLMSAGQFVNNTLRVELRSNGNYGPIQDELNR
jgi:hypothetical protein